MIHAPAIKVCSAHVNFVYFIPFLSPSPISQQTRSACRLSYTLVFYRPCYSNSNIFVLFYTSLLCVYPFQIKALNVFVEFQSLCKDIFSLLWWNCNQNLLKNHKHLCLFLLSPFLLFCFYIVTCI